MNADGLRRARELQQQAAEEGFDWPSAEGVWEKLGEELEELRRAADVPHRLEELGDVLFALVNLARHLGVDPEAALAAANAKFIHRYGFVRRQLEALPPIGDPRRLEHMERLWQQAKREERQRRQPR